MAEHKGGILNPPPRLLVEDNGASHPLRKSGGGLGMVSLPAKHVPGKRQSRLGLRKLQTRTQSALPVAPNPRRAKDSYGHFLPYRHIGHLPHYQY
jgi:hypothetical protein